MVRMSMNEITTYSWTFDEDVERYVAHGYEAIGVWRQKLADFGEERGIDLLAESGLQVSNLLWAGGFTGSDGRRYVDSVEDGLEAVELAAAMQAECLVVYTGSRAGHTHNHALKMIRRAVRDLAIVAADCGVTLAIEPVHSGCHGEWTLFHELTETLDFLSLFDPDLVKLVFDTYHLGQGNVTLSAIRDLAPRVGVVHLADAKSSPCGEQNRCLLGEGRLPIREIVEALIEGGFEGCFDVELMGQDVEHLPYEEILGQSKTALQELTRT